MGYYVYVDITYVNIPLLIPTNVHNSVHLILNNSRIGTSFIWSRRYNDYMWWYTGVCIYKQINTNAAFVQPVIWYQVDVIGVLRLNLHKKMKHSIKWYISMMTFSYKILYIYLPTLKHFKTN